ncbi:MULTISPECIES: hypothetical protein [Mycobacteroides]|uniref:hypothetical protein n=1 Tax=Mycobacteroides TaxID=670516 RepID=UPI0022323A93|nr:hypothetical protein [Mycobacteroides chelonae]
MALRTARIALATFAVITLGYLTVLAGWPGIRDSVPAPFRWFGAPDSASTIALVVVTLVALGLALTRRRAGATGVPVAIAAILAVLTLVLGFASYARCHDDSHPAFFTPLLWAVELVKGGDPAGSLDGGPCPVPMPAALHIAQVSAMAVVVMSVAGVAVALFQARLHRLRVRFARSLTVIVGLDDDAEPMVAAIKRSMRRRSSLVVITDNPDRDCVRRARTAGAAIMTLDLTQTAPLAALDIWNKLDRLYLLAADPSTNLWWLGAISARGGDHLRIPLVVRIDDPWQASAWRAQHFGGVHHRWAADTVGIYEVTARRLLDRVMAARAVREVLVCGSSQLTTALCSDMLQRRLEQRYSGRGEPTTCTVIAPNASDYLRDNEFAATQLGHPAQAGGLIAVDEEPTVDALLQRLQAGDAESTAVILVDSSLDVSAATRIAARLPNTIVHAWDPRADASGERTALLGRLYTYRLSLDLPGGQAHDAWERAAELIHNRYVRDNERTGPTARPWGQLDEFYRESNRRQVRNALWMVEKIGGHTWNTWGSPPDEASAPALHQLEPAECLRRMGFELPTAIAMARSEHEDWCRYYRKHGWRVGPRHDAGKVHDKLVDWAQIEVDPERLDAALGSLAATLTKLRELGYRSAPATEDTGWAEFRRAGEVLARQRPTAWTWTAQDGSTMRAEAGDWSVREKHPSTDATEWSVRDDIFRATHEHVAGRRWRRRGSVLARPARTGETVESLEGSVTASEGAWIVQGDHGDIWVVPGDEFARRYVRISS